MPPAGGGASAPTRRRTGARRAGVVRVSRELVERAESALRNRRKQSRLVARSAKSDRAVQCSATTSSASSEGASAAIFLCGVDWGFFRCGRLRRTSDPRRASAPHETVIRGHETMKGCSNQILVIVAVYKPFWYTTTGKHRETIPF